MEVAERMRRALREEDTVARLGGDEFCVLLPHVDSFDGVVNVTNKLMHLFRQPFAIADEPLIVTPSIGIAVYPQDGDDAEQLLTNADTAMYRAKEQGRNRYEIFSPALRTRTQDRLSTEVALLRALENREFVLHYQPKVELRTGRIVGAEALVRWQHPDEGLLFPGSFIPIAEESGLIVPIGEFILLEACRQTCAWQEMGLPPLTISVNVSARQFRQGIVDTTAAVLRTTGLEPHYLELELTESAAVESLEHTTVALEELRQMGVGCALDDFGTGYCSFKYLSQLPITTLKIDRSFVEAMSVRDASIVAAIITLGHSLGLRVVAEGVETVKQLGCLVAEDCDEVQGYLFSKPTPADQFAEQLRANAERAPGMRFIRDQSAPAIPDAAPDATALPRLRAWSPGVGPDLATDAPPIDTGTPVEPPSRSSSLSTAGQPRS
jgi:predicted signal transduction protein with EAL and GGDEF domain